MCCIIAIEPNFMSPTFYIGSQLPRFF